MREYTPDYWVVVKITPFDQTRPPHYRVFATWDGGFTYGASWKLNSGITHVEQDGPMLNFYGSSGSVYRCHEKGYRVNPYGAAVLAKMTNDGVEEKTVTIEVLDEATDFLSLLY